MSSPRRPLTEDETRRIDAMIASRTKGTLYDLLGVTASASPAEVEAAYHDLARQWHPDRFYSRDTGDRGRDIEENFVAATRAFRTLQDPLKRQGYNRDAGVVVTTTTVTPGVPRPPATPPPPPQTPLTPLGRSGVQAGETSPGGTRVYEARVPVAPPPEPPRVVPPPPPKVPTAVDKIRDQIGEQLGRARAYYDAGKVDFDAGRYTKAESALYLAAKFDPKNTLYTELYEKAVARSREGRAKAFIAQAETEESYQRIKEAIGFYLKAVECDPPEGTAYYRLALLLRNHEHDSRGAVTQLRKAITKEPRNIPYRLALCDLYESLNLHVNALREAQAALAASPKNEAAKAMVKRLKR